MEGDLTWGGEHTVQCTDDMLWNSATETCIILLTSVTTKILIKKREIGTYQNFQSLGK